MNAFNGALINLMETANARPLGNVEIREDGLAYCKTCGHPKQVRVKFPWGEETPRCVCKCEQEQIEREKAEEREQRRRELIRQNRHEAFPDKSYFNKTFKNADNDNLIEMSRRYVENFDKLRKGGNGLIFLGPVGCGKTYAAACIINALIDKGYKCKFTSFADIIKAKGQSDELLDFDLVVFDDFGVERWTDYGKEIVCSVINQLYAANIPCILTSNFTPDEFDHPSDMAMQRILSRLKERCLPLISRHADRRASNQSDIKNILGIS